MKTYFKPTALLFTAMLAFASCEKDENDAAADQETYTTTYKITDAPIDHAGVEAVFVTLTDVRVDGQSVNGFQATTIDLKSLVDGETETLGTLDMKAGSYSNVELVLDFEKDVNGTAPGCYVAMADGSKDALEASSNTISITDSYEIFAGTANEVVFDFDLRKTIRDNSGSSASTDFEFVSMTELKSGIRAVNAETTGTIEGTVSDSQDTSDKIVVYAYEKGTFDAEAETQGQGASQVQFANAVTSDVAGGLSGSYRLNFLEEGEYELIFVSYKEQQDGSGFEFHALLNAETATGLDLGAISVSSALQVNANVTITGTR